jgi:predicted XRE-type DNA-binding protein
MGIAQPDFEAAKTDVAARIHRLLEQRRVLPDAIAALLQIRESELSALFQGRLATCSLDQLLRILMWLGDDIDILIRPRGQGATRGTVRLFKTESVGRTDHGDWRRGSEATVTARRSEPQSAGTTSAPDRAAAMNKPRLLDKWEVEDVTSLDITTIYRKMKAGDFPKPLRSWSPPRRLAAIGHNRMAGGAGGRHEKLKAASVDGCSVVASRQSAVHARGPGAANKSV